MRHQRIESEARFTTVDTAQQLISFGEFAAMYLFIWCNELWDLQALADFDDLFAAFIDQREADGVTPLALPANWGAIFKTRIFRLTDEDDGIATLMSAMTLRSKTCISKNSCALCLSLTFRTLFQTSEALFEEPPVEGGAKALYRPFHAL
jgi:hypothetical protein